MTTHEQQRLIDDIQSLLQSGDPLALDGIGTLAGEYAALCEQANQRLRVCGDLLRQGLRTEALQQADHDPKLVDLVALLDFPDAGNWRALLAAEGIVQPPALLLEVAGEINEAYAIEEPLVDLLRRHRWHALARSPLNKRIGVVRQIAAADPMNLVWIEDLQTFEQARHQQIEQETLHAVKTRDADLLDELEAELREKGWSAVPPPELIQSTAQARARVQAARAAEELEQLARQLNDACSAFNVGWGRTLRSRWRACVKLANLPAGNRVVEMAAPALAWLEEQDQQQQNQEEHDREVAALEAALDHDKPRAVLERHYHALERLGLGIPLLLDRRYHERIQALTLAATRRNRLLIGVAAACLLLIAGVTGVVIVRQARAQEIASRAAVLQDLLSERKLEEARKYADDLARSHPELAGSAEIQEQQTRLVGLEAKETERRAAFRVALDRAQKAGLERPDDEALREARRLARTDAERLVLLRFEGELQASQQKLQADRDQQFAAELNAISQELKAFESDQRRSGETPADAVARIGRRLSGLLAGSGLVGGELQQQANLLKSRLDNHTAAQRRRQREVSLLDRVTAAVGNASTYRSELENYAKEFPQSPRSLAFQRVVAEEPPLWDGISRWNDAVRQWSSRNLSDLAPQAATALVKEAEPLLADMGDYPQAQGLKDRVAHAQAVASRVAEDGSRIHLRLIEVFNDPAVAGLWMVRDKQGRRYYTKVQPTPLGPRLRVKFLTGFDFAEESVSLAVDQVELNERAPQSVLSEMTIRELTRMTDSNWEAAFSGILQRLHSDTKLDPILKTVLLRRVVDVACQGSQPLARALETHRQRLNSPELKLDANWLKPGDADATTARIVAEAVVSSLPSPDEIAPQVAKAQAALRQPFAPRYTWTGWLVKDDALGWQCRTRDAHRPGDLYVVHRPAAGGVAIVKVGELRAGGATLSATDESVLVEGRPVFVAASTDS
jgi:hypothetical protein